MKDVLIITYHFPPFRTSGVYRHLKFAKYLGDFNWRPWIITAKNPSKRRIDHSLMSDIPPELPIHHTFTFELVAFQNWITELLQKACSQSGIPTNETPILFKAMNKLLGTFLMIPDDKIGWIPHTTIKALQLIKQDNILAFCTTSPPHSTHLIGLLLKKATGKPWIADFRDPWLHAFMKQPVLTSFPLRKTLEKLMERIVVKSADRIVTTSHGIKQHFLHTHGLFLEKKITVITNGFDDMDFDSIQETHYEKDNSRFLITHVGRLYPGKIEPFLKAFKHLVDNNSAFRCNAVVRLVGPTSRDVQDIVKRLDLDTYITHEGFQPHDQAIEAVLSSDLLLLMVGKETFWIPGKLFEYIRSKRPILVIGELGDAAQIAIRSGLGMLASHENIHEIAGRLLDGFQTKTSGIPIMKPDHEYIMRFSRRRLTSSFSRLLDSTI